MLFSDVQLLAVILYTFFCEWIKRKFLLICRSQSVSLVWLDTIVVSASIDIETDNYFSWVREIASDERPQKMFMRVSFENENEGLCCELEICFANLKIEQAGWDIWMWKLKIGLEMIKLLLVQVKALMRLTLVDHINFLVTDMICLFYYYIISKDTLFSANTCLNFIKPLRKV